MMSYLHLHHQTLEKILLVLLLYLLQMNLKKKKYKKKKEINTGITTANFRLLTPQIEVEQGTFETKMLSHYLLAIKSLKNRCF